MKIYVGEMENFNETLTRSVNWKMAHQGTKKERKHFGSSNVNQISIVNAFLIDSTYGHRGMSMNKPKRWQWWNGDETLNYIKCYDLDWSLL